MSIRIKLTLIISLFTCIVLVGLLWAISTTVKKDLEQDILENFQEKQQVLQKMQALIYDRLIESSLLIGQNAVFKANVSLKDAATVGQAVDEFSEMLKVDLLIVTDENGIVLNALNDPQKTNQSIRDRVSIKESLQGQFPDETVFKPIFWVEDEILYQIVSVPIYTVNELLGTLTLGMAMTDFEAEELQTNPDLDIHFVLKETIIASTAPEHKRIAFSNILPFFKKEYPVKPYLQEVKHEKEYLFFQRMGEGMDAWLMCTTNQQIVMRLLYQIEEKIWWIGLTSFGLMMGVSFFVGNTITKPLLKVVKALKKVQNGNLNAQLNLKSKDELGQLSLAFNQMVQGLKERIRLRKYVGEHTRALVLSEDSGKNQRIAAAVLFSDIRNFTKISDALEPEAVIDLLNDWLSFQADLVRENGGIIDKFVGDEMMAIFRGPTATVQAITCAKAIQQKTEQLAATATIPISLGIGINYGQMVMGNIGIADRMDYTVIGATVNLASRLCSYAPGGSILIPTPVLNLSAIKYDNEQVKKIQLKGLKQPVEVVNIL